MGKGTAPVWLIGPAALLVLTSCTPAPTATPTATLSKPVATPAQSAEKPAAPTAAPAKPTEPPVAAPETKPAAEKPAAKPAEDRFYEGKTIRFIVGLAAGGGYDTYTRTIARHFAKHVPGNPSIIVENMVGAAGLAAANHVYKVAPQDGTVINHFVGGLAYQELLKQPGIEFEVTKAQWLGAPTPDNFVCVVRQETSMKSLVEARGATHALNIGGTGPGGATDDVPKLLRAALDLNLKVVSGYGGTSQIRLAIDRGEADGACYSWESWKATSSDRIAAGDLVVVGQSAEKPLADLPGVPLFLDMAQTDEGRQLILNGIVARGRLERPYMVGPGVPKERVALLRDALMKTLRDPAFLEDAAKARLDVDPVTGEELERLIGEIFAMPEDLKARFRTVLTSE
jgi:tripartite-type tricarboxylate transporter receptor subunit TctC